MIRFYPVLILMLLVVGGCASFGSKGTNYETIKANPKRDTEAAAKLNRQGVEALAKGKLEKAERLFKEALFKDVNYGQAHNNLGRIYFDQGNNYLAAWEFEYAARVMPHRGEPYNNLGMVMERVGKLEMAIDAYETAYSFCPDHPEIVGNLARVYWCHDKDDPRTLELLELLVYVDTRPEWVAWAKEQIACGKFASREAVPAFDQPPPLETPQPTLAMPLPDAPIPLPMNLDFPPLQQQSIPTFQ